MSKKSQWLTLIVSGILMLSILALNGCATDQPHRAMAEKMIQSATTKDDHEAIAAHYEQEAESAMAKADIMRNHIEVYKKKKAGLGKLPQQKYDLIRHCKSLIGKYEKIAEENKQLANLHKRIATGN